MFKTPTISCSPLNLTLVSMFPFTKEFLEIEAYDHGFQLLSSHPLLNPYESDFQFHHYVNPLLPKSQITSILLQRLIFNSVVFDLSAVFGIFDHSLLLDTLSPPGFYNTFLVFVPPHWPLLLVSFAGSSLLPLMFCYWSVQGSQFLHLLYSVLSTLVISLSLMALNTSCTFMILK